MIAHIFSKETKKYYLHIYMEKKTKIYFIVSLMIVILVAIVHYNTKTIESLSNTARRARRNDSDNDGGRKKGGGGGSCVIS